jgi:hypothetical protein
MNPSDLQYLIDAFNQYKNTSIQVQRDVYLTEKFVGNAVDGYLDGTGKPFGFSTVNFGVFDLASDNQSGLLAVDRSVWELTPSNIENTNKKFFDWVATVSIIRLFSSLEVLLQQIVWKAHFENEMVDPMKEQKNRIKLKRRIVGFLDWKGLPNDSGKNEHLLQFLNYHHSSFEAFSSRLVRTDLGITWLPFLKFLAVVRNIIAHNDMVISNDEINVLKSQSSALFERAFYFEQDESGLNHIRLKHEQHANFLAHINDFAANTVKFVAGETDLRFLGLFKSNLI